MTDEQIEKALECCCSLDTTACGKCPYFKQRIGKECVSMSTKDAIALIKRQREEIERLTADRDEARRDCAVAERNHAYAEAERAEGKEKRCLPFP